MKKMIMLAALAACLNAVAGVGATTNWVAKYVADYVGNAISNSTGEVTARTTSVTTGETTVVTSGTAEVPIVMTITMPSVAGLVAADCNQSVAAQGITNGTVWAWSDANSRYERSGGLPIVPTSTNFVWNAIGSVSDNGNVAFKNGETMLFTVSGTFLTESQAQAIRGN